MILQWSLLATLVATSSANSLAQGLDFDVINDLPPIPAVSIPVGVAAAIVTVNEASAIAQVVALATKAPLTDAWDGAVSAPAETGIVTASALVKPRAATQTAVCSGGSPQPQGSGPASSPDTPAGFQANPAYGSAAKSAATPTGYVQTFSNLIGSTQAYGYLGFTSITSYNPSTCATQCSSINGCQSFNICK